MAQMVSQQVRNQLVVIDEKGVAAPELAESWEASPDAKQWTFNLQKGVEFHNGKTMDADDVIYTINLNRGENTKSPAKGILEPITEIKILKQWEPGVRAFATRNPNYFKEGLPYFDEVETLAMPDAVARTNALMTGQADVMARPDLKTVHMLKKSPKLQVVDVPGYAHYT